MNPIITKKYHFCASHKYGNTYWSEGSTNLKGGIPGSDTPRLNCPLAFKTHVLWEDLEFKFIDQVAIDWSNLPKGRRILSPFAHAQYYISKDKPTDTCYEEVAYVD